MASDQVRGVDPDTGGEKGLKLASIGDACPKALMEIAKVYGHGRKKYSRGNYLSGYTWNSSYDALQRHLLLFWAGEERDGEGVVNELVEQGADPNDAWQQVIDSTDDEGHSLYSGLHHMAHAGWHCICLLAFTIRKIGTDDRL